MDKTRRGNALLGAILVIVGVFFLAYSLEWLPDFSAYGWAVVFGAFSLLFLAYYIDAGWRRWPMLFPAVGCAAIAAILAFDESGVQGSWLGGLFMVVVSIPFWVAYLADRTANRWALIPGWATAAIGVVVVFADTAPGELIGALVLYAIALPFAAVYLANRKNWWALIPAYALVVLGTIALIADRAQGETIGGVVILATALPFGVVYLANRKNWWALIPGGIMGLIGVILLLIGTDLSALVVPAALIVVGLWMLLGTGRLSAESPGGNGS